VGAWVGKVHQLVDRPKLPANYETFKSREFVQPQWVVDCANFMFLLPIERYAVGVTLPPHLSPWVDDEEEGYKPAYAEEIERLKNGELITDTEAKDKDNMASEEEQPIVDDSVNNNDGSDEESIPLEEEKEESVKEKSEQTAKAVAEKESHDLAKGMMSKKATRLYNRMQHGLSAKKAKVEDLKRKRQEIEQSSKTQNTDKVIAKDSNERITPQKQKVIRLKKERRKTEKQYSDTGGSMKKSKKR
jgi:pescadillo